VKLGSDSNGPAVLEPGTVLVIQKAGIRGVPPGAVIAGSVYQDGSLRQAAGGRIIKGLGLLNRNVNTLTKSDSSRPFQVGEKVYPTDIKVELSSEKITFGIVSCDSCNGVNPPNFFKSRVTFQFANGYLEKAAVPEVEGTISQVFAFDTSANTEGNGAQSAAQQTQDAQPPQPPSPASIELGQTVDQVTASFGPPEKTVNLGAKQIYVYKDLKVTFQNGKVVDVQ